MKRQSRTLDRIVSFDERSRAFPIRQLVPADAPRRSYTWRCSVNLDQGTEGACAGFAVAQEAAARPVTIPGVTNAIARALYVRARQLDAWPGENYEGTSVLAAIKAGAEHGWYKEYRWAFGEEDLALAVGYKGPAVLGLPWYDGMFMPDAAGVIHPTGKLVGGHAILCNGYSTRTHLYRLHNSWGPAWGVGGDCFLSDANMMWLLRADGEACIPVIRAGGKTL